MTELVTSDYLARALKFNPGLAKKICREQSENMSTKVGTRAMYKKSELDKLIDLYKIGIKPVQSHERNCLGLSKHFKISLLNARSLVNHENFPKPARTRIPSHGGRYFVWNLADVKDLNLADFGEYQYRKHKQNRLNRPDSPPFSWSGLQAQFIRLCRPGGLLFGNFNPSNFV